MDQPNYESIEKYIQKIYNQNDLNELDTIEKDIKADNNLSNNKDVNQLLNSVIELQKAKINCMDENNKLGPEFIFQSQDHHDNLSSLSRKADDKYVGAISGAIASRYSYDFHNKSSEWPRNHQAMAKHLTKLDETGQERYKQFVEELGFDQEFLERFAEKSPLDEIKNDLSRLKDSLNQAVKGASKEDRDNINKMMEAIDQQTENFKTEHDNVNNKDLTSNVLKNQVEAIKKNFNANTLDDVKKNISNNLKDTFNQVDNLKSNQKQSKKSFYQMRNLTEKAKNVLTSTSKSKPSAKVKNKFEEKLKFPEHLEKVKSNKNKLTKDLADEPSQSPKMKNK